jgi:hypothetical protein
MLVSSSCHGLSLSLSHSLSLTSGIGSCEHMLLTYILLKNSETRLRGIVALDFSFMSGDNHSSSTNDRSDVRKERCKAVSIHGVVRFST